MLAHLGTMLGFVELSWAYVGSGWMWKRIAFRANIYITCFVPVGQQQNSILCTIQGITPLWKTQESKWKESFHKQVFSVTRGLLGAGSVGIFDIQIGATRVLSGFPLQPYVVVMWYKLYSINIYIYIHKTVIYYYYYIPLAWWVPTPSWSLHKWYEPPNSEGGYIHFPFSVCLL